MKQQVERQKVVLSRLRTQLEAGTKPARDDANAHHNSSRPYRTIDGSRVALNESDVRRISREIHTLEDRLGITHKTPMSLQQVDEILQTVDPVEDDGPAVMN